MRIDLLFPIAADLEILLPDGSKSGIVLKVVGQDSKRFRDVAKRYAQGMLGKELSPDIDALERQNMELVASCVIGWSGLEDSDGTPMPFSEAKALELISMPELSFMREQVERYVAQRQNFFRAGQVPA